MLVRRGLLKEGLARNGHLQTSTTASQENNLENVAHSESGSLNESSIKNDTDGARNTRNTSTTMNPIQENSNTSNTGSSFDQL